MAEAAESSYGSILAVDVGNTCTGIGLFREGELVASWNVATRERTTSDEARLTVRGLLCTVPDGCMEAPCVDDSILSCVVPDLTPAWVAALSVECGRKPFLVGPGTKTGMKMRYRDPAEIGSDRIADVVAARERYGFPLVVVDFGTTTNLEVIDAEGAFAGGIIAPGVELSALAVARAAARLPVVEIRAPRTVIGRSTAEAMQAGIVMGEVARIDGLIRMIWDELGYETGVAATGEGAAALCALSARIEQADETLTLRGLERLYRMNRLK